VLFTVEVFIQSSQPIGIGKDEIITKMSEICTPAVRCADRLKLKSTQ